MWGVKPVSSYSIVKEKCVGCTLCAKICPVGAISGDLKEPHAIDPERCIRCGACGRVCAKQAVLDEQGESTERVNRNLWKNPHIYREACVGCKICVEECPKGCLSISDPSYHGDIGTKVQLSDPENCLGCGLCEKVCPIEAIAMAVPGESVKPYNGIKRRNTMSRIWCRTFQACMKVASYFLGYRMPEYIDGPGSIQRLPEFMKDKGAKKVLVVTDGGLMKLGLLNGMLKSFEDNQIDYVVYSEVSPNPTSDNVEAGYKLYAEHGCQCLVAFGGGSPMDCGKAIAAKAVHPNKSVAQLQGLLKVHKRIPLFFAVPTTAGTGSETTVAAVITDSATHHKASINDPSILPKYAVLDPELTVGLPPFITATTGLDALCHAVESYTNHTYHTKLEDQLAKDAVKLVHKSLLKAYQDGKDIEARQDMQMASFFAGRAFTRGCVGYVHAVGHTLGGLYGMPHGLAMGTLLPHVMRQFGAAAHRRLAELADVIELPGANDAEKAENFIRWIENLKQQMNIPVGVEGIKDEDIPQMIKWAMKEANPLYPVPQVWGEADFRTLIETIRQ